MYHPLYYQASRYVGRPVYIHHVNGRTYHGTIMSVAHHGIYVVQHSPGTSLAAADDKGTEARLAAQDGGLERSRKLGGNAEIDLDLVYSPGAYFGFGALTGLTLGAMAGGMWW